MPVINFQDSPQWLQDYTQELIKKARKLGAEEYIPYGVVSEERNKAIQREVEKLRAKQLGNEEYDIIPISITGTSEPIKISPPDLFKIINNENFAREVYEKTTGSYNIPKNEIDNFRERAQKIRSSYAEAISKWEGMKEQRERNLEKNQRDEYYANIDRNTRLNEVNKLRDSIKNEISSLENDKKSYNESISLNEKKIKPSTFGKPQNISEVRIANDQINKDRDSLKLIEDQLKERKDLQKKLGDEKKRFTRKIIYI